MAKGFEWQNIITDRNRVEDALRGKKTACVFDTETTGLVGKNGIESEEEIKIIQFSGILYSLTEDGHLDKEIDSLDTYLFPEEPISEEVTKITGITNEMLMDAPTEDEAAWKIFRFMDRANVWIAYNAPYDLNKLKTMSTRTGVDFNMPYDGKDTDPTVIDVLPMARYMLDPEPLIAFRTERNKTLPVGEKDAHGIYKLQYVTPVLFPDFEAKFHDSMEDVKSTAKVYDRLLDMYRDYEDPFKGEERLDFKTAKFKIVNPYHSPYTTRRILVYVPGTEDTDRGPCYVESGIFYDVSKKLWTCDSKTPSKKLFKSISLPDLEKDVLDWAIQKKIVEFDKYTIPNMGSLVREMENSFYQSSQGAWVKKIIAKSTANKKETKKQEDLLAKVTNDFDIDLD